VCGGFRGTQVDTVSACGGLSSPKVLKHKTVHCGEQEGGYGCTTDQASLDGGTFDTSPVGTFPATHVSKNRYYGFWSYGKAVPQADGGTVVRAFSDEAEADAFDRTRLREARLVDVTDGGTAGPASDGWRLEYGQMAERTASGSGVLASCVVWNSLEFQTDNGSRCAVGGTNQARIYQANMVTGPRTARTRSGGRMAPTPARSPAAS